MYTIDIACILYKIHLPCLPITTVHMFGTDLSNKQWNKEQTQTKPRLKKLNSDQKIYNQPTIWMI